MMIKKYFILLVGLILSFLFSCNNATKDKKPTTDKETQPKVEIPTYKNHWDFYFGTIDQKLASIYVNMGFISVSPIKGFDHLANINMELKSPNATNGLASAQEADVLFEMETYFEENLMRDSSSLYVGRFTTDGYRTLSFYTNDTAKFKMKTAELIEKYPEYDFNFGVQYDVDWTVYTDFLYPNSFQMESINNRRILGQLKKAGDQLTIPRDLEHWAYFKTDYDRANFVEKAKTLQFEIVEQSVDDSTDSKHPYAVMLSRKDSVNYNSIEQVTQTLMEIALENSGVYDGWGTEVIEIK